MKYEMKNWSWSWIVITALIAVDAGWMGMAHLSVPWKPVLLYACVVGVFLAVAAVYSYLRPDERLAAMAASAAQLFAYSVSGSLFSYLIVTLRRPLIDSNLDAADRAIGFDWPALYAWVGQHEAIKEVLTLAYGSVIPQIGLLVVLLISWKRYDRMRSFIWLYIVCGLSYVVLSGFFPAVGAFGYYQTALDTPYVQHFQALRAGDGQTLGLFRTLDLFRLQGVVQFPSFHLTLAVLCAYATRGIRFLFPAFVILNLLVIAATPSIGGHFFADLWASALLTGILIYFVDRRTSLIAGCGRAGKWLNNKEVEPTQAVGEKNR